jgi:nucleotide-binding universal stress UspA family protein
MTSKASGSAPVVVGVDDSPAAGAALHWAAAEARLRNLPLHVVHVRDSRIVVTPGHLGPPVDGTAAADRGAAESALKERVGEAIGQEPLPEVLLELVDGLPVRVLLDRAAGAALLVLGSSRSSARGGAPVGKPAAPLGPVARGCLRVAPCPVVIVTGQLAEPPRICGLAHSG